MVQAYGHEMTEAEAQQLREIQEANELTDEQVRDCFELTLEIKKKQEEQRQEREQKRREIEERWEQQKAVFEANAETWEGFRAIVFKLFEARLIERDGQPFTRRPPWSMRLMANGEPPAHLAVRPWYARSSHRGQPGTLSPEKLEVELMVARLKKPDGSSHSATGAELTCFLEPGQARYRGGGVNFGLEAVERALAVATAFVADPAQVLALSSDHCCLCGRPLTDERSRSRGVGPECLRFLNGIVGTIAERKAKHLFEDWKAEAIAT